MGMRNDRAIVLAVERVLKEYSDEDHILTMEEFKKKLQMEYDLFPDRRTIASAIQTLAEFGHDISTYSENKRGYYLRQRTFEPSEIRLIMDAIYTFKGVPPKQSADLIQKLQSDMSRFQRKRFRHLKTVKPAFKTKNQQVFLNIELIDEAISSKKRISFRYNRYDINLKLSSPSGKTFEVDPYLMLCANERYYLIGNHVYHDKISHYRLDRMTDMSILDTEAKPAPPGVNFEEYVEKADGIYFGQEALFTFRCKRGILDDVIDRFGTGVKPYNLQEETFDFSMKLVDKAAIFFALEYLSRCEILEPESARERMRRYIRSGSATYAGL